MAWLVLGSEKATGGLLDSEKTFVDPKTGNRLPWGEPFQNSKDLVFLSVIIPAFREESRLSLGVDAMIPFLTEREAKDPSKTWEIVIVDDGSPDRTTDVALEYSKRYSTSKVRVLNLKLNRGKGGAVKRGMMVARGKYLLMADADGATQFSDLANLEAKLMAIEKDGQGVAVGSRAHLEEADVVRKRSLLRNILMWGFHFLVSFVGGIRNIRDTQCGFKLFTRDTARILFSNLHIERWCFDVELLFIASKFHIPVTEVPVNWQEIDGSKLDTFWSSIQMLRDLFRIRLCYMLGYWSAKK